MATTTPAPTAASRTTLGAPSPSPSPSPAPGPAPAQATPGAGRRREDLLALLFSVANGLVDDVQTRMEQAGYGDVRRAHGCVFSNIEPDGLRLTDLAERAEMTKQGVGEAVSDLERLGYAERARDPSDGRAKIIRLTERGSDAQAAAFEIIAEIEREWARRYGAERVQEMRALLLELSAARCAPPV
ncbi:MAG TPA: MarR family winged helix-turn-helix transcriptional regulator [Solirubrobacteraceae bacterium]|nr:MarR family winged helix-turn-helix transcriptional regulator [Solirubrobacteraceae bacterium]